MQITFSTTPHGIVCDSVVCGTNAKAVSLTSPVSPLPGLGRSAVDPIVVKNFSGDAVRFMRAHALRRTLTHLGNS